VVDTEDERDGWLGLIERLGRDVLLGGEWRPALCEANTHLAVIIPCRDRDVHLRILLRHFIPVLQRQLVHFRIFVVEQVLKSSLLLQQLTKLDCTLAQYTDIRSKIQRKTYSNVPPIPFFCLD